jgi:hypothetical protein
MDNFKKAVTPNSEHVFSRESVESFCKPCIYFFMRENQCLYIGKSVQGIVRPFNPGHHAQQAKEKSDRVLIWFFDDPERIDVVEYAAIRVLRPLYNVTSNNIEPRTRIEKFNKIFTKQKPGTPAMPKESETPTERERQRGRWQGCAENVREIFDRPNGLQPLRPYIR